MTKKCKIVKIVNNINNDTKIPDWYKKDNNYSLFIDLINKKKNYDPSKGKLKKQIPKLTDKKISIELHNVEKNTWFLYWASNSTKKETEIKNSKDAYNDFKNHGLVKSNSEGKCKFILNCPQIYTENNITFPRHIHYTTINKDNNWKKEFKTIIVKCLIDFKKIKFFSEKKSMIIFNALPKKYYDKEHIPNSLNLSYKYLKKYSKQEQFAKIKKLIEINLHLYPKIKNLYDSGKIDIKNIPIITYCAHCDCNASDILLNILNDLGFVNILEYPGGMKDWNENKGDIETKESESKLESKSESKSKSELNEDIFNLNYKLEKLIVNDKEYEHNIYTEEVLFNNKKVGLWNGKNIEYDKKSNTKKSEVKVIKNDYNDKIDELKNTLEKINKKTKNKYSFEKISDNYGISFF